MTEAPPVAAAPARVTVTDVDIPFGSLMVLLLKLTLAAIPALLLLFVLSAVATGMLGAILSVR